MKQALLDLLRERGYDAITITDLTERADVGRSTFYSHYGSKEDLLFSGFDRWLRSLAEASDSAPTGPAPARPAPGFRFSLPLLRHLRSQEHFSRSVLGGGSGRRIRRRITALLAQAARTELESRERLSAPPDPACRGAEDPTADVRLDGLAHAAAGALLGLAGWWLSRAPHLSAEEVDRIFQDLVTPE